jgi:hypothetical protein
MQLQARYRVAGFIGVDMGDGRMGEAPDVVQLPSTLATRTA